MKPMYVKNLTQCQER